jgi:hypothetical protein
MPAKMIALVAGLSAGGALSQFPTFSQQYIQRLGGQIDALESVVADFDRTVEGLGLTREEALRPAEGPELLVGLQENMTQTLARLDRLQLDKQILDLSTPLERMTQPYRFTDTDTFRATWQDFRPGVQLGTEGFLAAGIGFAGGWLAAWGLMGAIMMLFRRRPA